MKRILFVLCILLGHSAVAQHTREDLLEFLQQGNEEGTDFQQWFDELEELRTKPLNLNTAGTEEIGRLILLDQTLVKNLLDYRLSNGPFSDWQELLRIEKFTPEVIELIKPYAIIGMPGKTLSSDIKGGRFEQITRFSKVLADSKGYQPQPGKLFAAYPGSAVKLFTRTKYSVPGVLSVNLVTEKDPGETLFGSGHRYSPDHTVASVLYNPKKGPVSRIVIGDYLFSSGLGLVFNPGFGMFKSVQITQVYHPLPGLRSYNSVNESGFFRGAAATFGRKKLSGTLLLSSNKIDATLDPKTGEITSIYSTGLHRTESELRRRKAATRQSFGGSLEYRDRRNRITANFLHSQLLPPVAKPGEGEYNAGISLHRQFSAGMLFGEVAVNHEQQTAAVGGILLTLSQKVSSILIYRNYAAGYTSSFGNAFSNSGKLQNERGWFAGMDYQLDHRNKISAYLDQYRYPGPSFYTAFPADQRDMILQWNHSKKRKLLVYGRGRWQLTQRDSVVDKLEKSYSRMKYNYRIHWEWNITKTLTIKQRAEYTTTMNKTQGLLVYQDIVYKPFSKIPALSGRLARFQTASYDDRIYAYENDVLYSYSIPAYFNTGYRYYLMVHGSITRKLDYWLRYSNWIYSGVEKIGSGNDEIAGNTKPQVQLQLRITMN
ncbi:MAG: helix-hairpin-helix domain-containing protein [Bacteroidota bacterium]